MVAAVDPLQKVRITFGGLSAKHHFIPPKVKVERSNPIAVRVEGVTNLTPDSAGNLGSPGKPLCVAGNPGNCPLAILSDGNEPEGDSLKKEAAS